MNTPTSTMNSLKAKGLAAAILLCLAGSVHSPKVEAQAGPGIPTFDFANIFQMLRDMAKDAITDCFSADSLKESLKQIQDIQALVQRARAMQGITELMPERDELEGIEACPGGASLASQGGAVLRSALGMGNKRIDGSTDLVAMQKELCVSAVVLQNQKWNAQRELLLEIDGQAEDYKEIFSRWNSLANMKSEIQRVCNPVPGGSMSVSGGGASEGQQATVRANLEAKAADNDRAIEQARAKIEVLSGALVSIEAKQAEVGRRMLSGETGGGWLSNTAAGAIQAALLKRGLEKARTD